MICECTLDKPSTSKMRTWTTVYGFDSEEKAAEEFASLKYEGVPVNNSFGMNVWLRVEGSNIETRYLVRTKVTIEWAARSQGSEKYK